jgi:hypothetical protein
MGHIYVAINTAMPDLVKVGSTTNLSRRIRALSAQTGAAFPFRVFGFVTVADHEDLEGEFKTYFKAARVNPRREFFELPPSTAMEFLNSLVRERRLRTLMLHDVFEEDGGWYCWNADRTATEGPFENEFEAEMEFNRLRDEAELES